MWIVLILLLSYTVFGIEGLAFEHHVNNQEKLEENCVRKSAYERFQLNENLFQLREYDAREMYQSDRMRRKVDTKFHGHPKPRNELLANNFHLTSLGFDQTTSLVTLVNKIALKYLSRCPPVIYYDNFVEQSDGLILENLFKTFPLTFFHGKINDRFEAKNVHLVNPSDKNCMSFILFLSDPLMTRKIIGPQTENRVLLVARSTQWKLREFLSSEESSNIVNLLVVGESLTGDLFKEKPYVLYTHTLFSDGLGSNSPIVLTSWVRGVLSRPHIDLYPKKFENGFAGHRFQIAASNQPPFIFKFGDIDRWGNQRLSWDGIEYRLLNLIAKKLNFLIDIYEAPFSGDTVKNIQILITRKNVDFGMGGIYITEDRINVTDMTIGHSKDCAAFITLASRALPKYRAIMGPFQWPVWVALVFVYLGAIFPIVYTDRLSLSHLIGNWSEIENMFWYVFGMFTNSFTFSGRYSWSNTKKNSTRLLIGSYWLFTIIITACYTGSIIAFVTLPAFPDTIDSVNDLLGLFFRVGTLNKEGWETWFQNSTHIPTAKLYKKMEFVESFEEGIGNVTQSFFWNYAFLGSKGQLEYMVQKNFSNENIARRSALHLSDECFALFQIGFLLPRNAVYKRKINSMILLAQQSGLINKIENEVKWTMQRSSSGKLLQASASSPLRELVQDERQLTTADTEGMFLLMGIGYLLGVIALISEIVGGITNKCRQILKRSRRSDLSQWSSKRNSMADVTERTSAEEKAHLKRKAERKKQFDEENPNQSFGVRELHLTRTTLKELYGNYYKPEPNYFVKNGKLMLQTDSMSTDSTDCNSPDSVAQLSKGPKLYRRSKSKTLVLAEVNINGQEESRHFDDVPEEVYCLDQTIEEFEQDPEENGPNEEQLFGSEVSVHITPSNLDVVEIHPESNDTEEQND